MLERETGVPVMQVQGFGKPLSFRHMPRNSEQQVSGSLTERNAYLIKTSSDLCVSIIFEDIPQPFNNWLVFWILTVQLRMQQRRDGLGGQWRKGECVQCTQKLRIEHIFLILLSPNSGNENSMFKWILDIGAYFWTSHHFILSFYGVTGFVHPDRDSREAHRE